MVPLSHRLTLSCANVPGIVAAVSAYLFEAGCNIQEAQQYDDVETGRFFMRIVFNVLEREGRPGTEALRDGFRPVADRFRMSWAIRAPGEKRRVMLLASRFDHCLNDLLYRWRTDELDMEVSAIVSNYGREAYVHSLIGDLPFHHLPITRETKMEQEAQL